MRTHCLVWCSHYHNSALSVPRAAALGEFAGKQAAGVSKSAEDFGCVVARYTTSPKSMVLWSRKVLATNRECSP
jgi:hypothetical protein